MHQIVAKTWRFLHIPKHLQLFIMRLTNDEFLVGVTGVIVNIKNEVLVLEHTYRQTPWSLPGGYLKRGEHPLTGIEREIHEETGFVIKGEKISKTTHDPETARLDIVCFARLVSGTFTPSAEVSNYGWYSYETMPFIGKRQKKLVEEGLKAQTTYFTKRSFWTRMFSH